MTPATLKALKASIKHWERMRDNRNGGDRPGGDFCALCENQPRYMSAGVSFCAGCPVHERTGCGCCRSPYHMAAKAFYNGAQDQWIKKAQAEIDFLKSLLPRRKKAKPKWAKKVKP